MHPPSPKTCGSCKLRWKSGDLWVGCDKTEGCKKRFHSACVGLKDLEATTLENLQNWLCPTCILKKQPSSSTSETGNTTNSVDAMVANILNSNALRDAMVTVLKEMLPDLIKEMLSKECAQLIKEEVAKANLGNPTPPTFAEIMKSDLPFEHITQLAKEIRKEEAAHEEKKDRLVVRGITIGEERENELAVREMAESIGVSLEGTQLTINSRHMGKQSGQGLMSVKLPQQKRSELLRNAKKLRDVEGYQGVFINPDMTPGERHADYLLRCELKEKRQRTPDKKWVISRGRVIERQE